MQTILVVDDNQDFLDLLRYVLAQDGYRVLTALDGRQGVIEAKRERPDLILMDVRMPGHDGVETAAYLQAIGRFSGIPIVFLTGLVAEDKPEGGDTINIDGREYPMIPKMSDSSELLRRIKVYLAQAQRKTLRVLLIEDSPTDAHLIARALEKSSRRDFKVSRASSLHDGEEFLKGSEVDVIVLDLGLPDSPRKATLLWMLRQEEPIVVITGDEDDLTVSEAFRHGAQDYLPKGDFSEREVVRCVMYALERVMIRKELLLYKNNVERIVKDRVNEALILEKERSGK